MPFFFFKCHVRLLQVVVIEQNKLYDGSTDGGGKPSMLATQCSHIATRALAASVQAIVDAVDAPQLLHLVAGAPLDAVQYCLQNLHPAVECLCGSSSWRVV